MARGENTANHPSRQVGPRTSRMRAILGNNYTSAELHEAAARGRTNSALEHGSSMPRRHLTLAERLRDPDDE